MKTSIKNFILLHVSFTCLSLLLADPLVAQAYSELYSFSAYDDPSLNINGDGADPYGGVVISSNTLYGTASGGGNAGAGTVFAINTDGSGFTTLFSFSGGSDGKGPLAGLVLSGNTLYGTTSSGGNGVGNVFAINTDGSGFTDLYDFTYGGNTHQMNSDGYGPNYLALSRNTLYGTAGTGGLYGNGTVFAINTDGSGFTTLHNFGPPSLVSDTRSRNTEGAGPYFGVIISGDTLYGTTESGGASGYGTIFKLNTNGTGYTVLHNFTAPSDSTQTNSDGASGAGLVMSGNTLYGNTLNGGSSGNGTVFRINTDGSGFTTIYSGIARTGSLVLSGSTLYWKAFSRAVFAVNTDGTGFTTLYSGTAGFGLMGLVLSGNTAYGTTALGGSSGHGTVFSFVLPPQLTLSPSGTNVILTWPTNATGFVLQSSTELGSSAVWSTNTSVPVVVNGLNTVTNPISGRQQFFRLSQ